MPVPAELIPLKPLRVMDLVREAGVDVDDWKNFKKGPQHAASNPKYCYRWSFLQPGRVVVHREARYGKQAAELRARLLAVIGCP